MKYIKAICGTGLLVMAVSIAVGQEKIMLYNTEVPNSKPLSLEEVHTTDDNGVTRVTDVTNPTLTAYFPPENAVNSGKAVIICPGGGYAILAITHEGHDVAKRFAANGISAFVLKYRLPKEDIMVDKRKGPLQDAQRAIQLVRERASEWGIAENQIGIAGFSAGGHLAATLSTHYREALVANPQHTSLRPDFSLLVYPVISMQAELTHGGSRKKLLGDHPTADDVTFFSNELQVTADTPPAFLVHAEDDMAVPIANSEAYVAALNSHGVDSKLLTYPKGGHGFGLNNTTTTDKWFDHFITWLASR